MNAAQSTRCLMLLGLLLLPAWCHDAATVRQAVAHDQLAADSAVAAGESQTDKLGAIQGVVTWKGEVPQARVADNTGQRRALLSVDRRTGGLRYAVAYLDLPTSADHDARPDHGRQRVSGPSSQDEQLQTTVIDQLEHTFVPHLVAIRDGQMVKFTNSDPANHNVRASSLVQENEFNVFTGAGKHHQHQFHADRKVRPILLSCDLHPWMRGWVYVFEHPHFAVSGKKGDFILRDVPPGKYRLMVRQPDVGYSHTQEIVARAGQVTRVRIEIDSSALKGF